ncbi:hypothetical protein SAMN06265219_10284 [Gracilimonas mengyeensis]|uniref:Uncharacterized protein n=1 Tax=Gracilimonas mengyeensis TaxID=1302730 RepID=A0A521B805_9BACT|nr:hypothetical protein SAMN06265219_10284 [Gracilimonas mengyeensis]
MAIYRKQRAKENKQGGGCQQKQVEPGRAERKFWLFLHLKIR